MATFSCVRPDRREIFDTLGGVGTDRAVRWVDQRYAIVKRNRGRGKKGEGARLRRQYVEGRQRFAVWPFAEQLEQRCTERSPPRLDGQWVEAVAKILMVEGTRSIPAKKPFIWRLGSNSGRAALARAGPSERIMGLILSSR